MHPETKAKGDNDPLDVCEIGEQVGYVGQVKQVKVLGIMALLDEGETDWKVIVIDVRDPLASRMNDIEDVERQLPGLIRATNEWFRIYKIPDGKPENNFAFSGEAKNKKYATEIIHECHEAWRRLVSGESPAKTASYDLSMYVNVPADRMFWTYELTSIMCMQSQHHHSQLPRIHAQGRPCVPEPPFRLPQAPCSHRPLQYVVLPSFVYWLSTDGLLSISLQVVLHCFCAGISCSRPSCVGSRSNKIDFALSPTTPYQSHAVAYERRLTDVRGLKR